jgi:hypothetical protein
MTVLSAPATGHNPPAEFLVTDFYSTNRQVVIQQAEWAGKM